MTLEYSIIPGQKFYVLSNNVPVERVCHSISIEEHGIYVVEEDFRVIYPISRCFPSFDELLESLKQNKDGK